MCVLTCLLSVVCSRPQPENLLLDEQLNIKIADFGMAQLMRNNSILKTSCGSPHYASPEIIEGHTYDAKVTDVWSIGVILYALITGSLPFDHDNIPTLLSMVTKGVYQTPAHVPSDVAHLISRMLTVDPSKRIKLCEIRKHPAYRGTRHFKQLVKGSSWPYNVRRDKQRKQKRLRRVDSPSGSSSASSSSELEQSDDSDSDQYVEDSVLTDLEALGLDFNGNREELRAKIKQRSSSSQQPNIERVFYRLLKKRRNSRLEQLSLLSPKISPRSYGGASGTGYFNRAVSEPEGTYAALTDREIAASPMMSSEPTSRASSAVAANVSGMEGEWVRNMHSSSSTATTEGNASTTSQVSTGSARQPISPLALDDANEYDRQADGSDPYTHYELPDTMRMHSAPHTELPTAGSVQRETSAAAYYNRMVARTSPPTTLTSMSVPPSPCFVSSAAVVASAPSSPLFSSASPYSMSPASASAPHTSALKGDVEYMAPEPYVSTSTRRVPIERRSSNPGTANAFSSGPTSPAHSRARQPSDTPLSNVARRLFVAEEKHLQADVDDSNEPLRLTSTKSERLPGRSPHARTRSESDQRSKLNENGSPDFVSTPRFHRVRFNGDKQNGLLSSPTHGSSTSPPQSAFGSPVAKRSWFSSIFSRRPSLDLFNRANRTKKPNVPSASSSAVHKPITGVYSNKETLSIADEVRKALKAAGVRYVVKKGNSNGASVFDCEVGEEDEDGLEEVQRGMRFLTRRKSTTAIDVPTLPPAAIKEGRLPAGRRGSVGSSLLGSMARTAPMETAHIPLAPVSQRSSSPNRRRTALPIPPAPRHSTQSRSSRTDESEEKVGTGSRSANTTPRHGGSTSTQPTASPPPHHTRHSSLRSPQPVVANRPVSPHRAVSMAATSSPVPAGSRRRANSMEEAGDDESPVAAPLSPAVRFVVEITSHHSNDLRCVRFVHIGGDETVYRQVQNDVQARLHL